MYDGSLAMHDAFFLFCNINAKKRTSAKHFNVCSLFQSGGYRPGWGRWGRPYGRACEPADGPVLGHLSRVQQIDLWPVFWHLTRVQQTNCLSMCHQDTICSFNRFNKCRLKSMTFSGMNEG